MQATPRNARKLSLPSPAQVIALYKALLANPDKLL
jgi:hypothetical protein